MPTKFIKVFSLFSSNKKINKLFMMLLIENFERHWHNGLNIMKCWKNFVLNKTEYKTQNIEVRSVLQQRKICLLLKCIIMIHSFSGHCSMNKVSCFKYLLFKHKFWVILKEQQRSSTTKKNYCHTTPSFHEIWAPQTMAFNYNFSMTNIINTTTLMAQALFKLNSLPPLNIKSFKILISSFIQHKMRKKKYLFTVIQKTKWYEILH